MSESVIITGIIAVTIITCSCLVFASNILIRPSGSGGYSGGTVPEGKKCPPPVLGGGIPDKDLLNVYCQHCGRLQK